MKPDVSDDPDGEGGPASPLSGGIAELAADPRALRWARECAWLPGTGYCRNRPCSAECLFRPQREAEMMRLKTDRRRRRSG